MSEPSQPQRAVTLADVAAQAGVSKAAASKALNNRDDVSASTRARVLAAATALGYTKPPRTGPLPCRPSPSSWRTCAPSTASRSSTAPPPPPWAPVPPSPSAAARGRTRAPTSRR
ncbi:LacI family DNA-binding transcriptional regulator [Actinomyces sp. 186855]|nr:LacI family DNA-binding transcriptional regulator [Actinomyces sp. AC-20-1]MCL3789021.1 LacI family DNA-binding transcriptional regulator [Actinomyces sp. 187325]MCL3791376.1 LacI family DNA-binding transcriptional regulator [Actinomyces sp. 186855]MCL3793913.1 LacI family DNA-binding transcriptional regulator [Actinomyces sp. 217892]